MHDVLTARSSRVWAWATDSQSALSGFLWLGVVVLAVMAGVVFLATLRRRFRDEASGVLPPFSLAELRNLKETGTVNSAEYESLRRFAVEGPGSGGGAKA